MGMLFIISISASAGAKVADPWDQTTVSGTVIAVSPDVMVLRVDDKIIEVESGPAMVWAQHYLYPGAEVTLRYKIQVEEILPAQDGMSSTAATPYSMPGMVDDRAFFGA
jgi:hypothetical protein